MQRRVQARCAKMPLHYEATEPSAAQHAPVTGGNWILDPVFLGSRQAETCLTDSSCV